MRQVALHVRRVLPEAAKEGAAKLGPEGRGALEQVGRPGPRDEPERDLEAAGPVDPHTAWIRRDPASDVAGEDLREALVPRQAIRLTESHHPLVAIQLPDDLAIADGLAVQRVDPAPVAPGRAAATHWVQMPVHRIAESELPVTEEVETALDQRLSLVQDAVAGPRGPLIQQRGGLPVGRAGKEARAWDREDGVRSRCGAGVQARETPVDPLRGLLPGPAAYLRWGHLEEAPHVHGGLAGAR